jgi:ribosome-binding factor A
MSHRREQLESSLMRTIGMLLAGGLNDPRISGLVSVTGVTVSADGRTAAVKVSVLPEDRQRTTLHGLRHAAGHIQKLVLQQLRIRFVPHLDFQLDESLKKQAKVISAINEAVKDLPPEAPKSDDAQGPPDSPEATR